MKLEDFLAHDLVAKTKNEAIRELAKIILDNNKIPTDELGNIINAVLRREEKGSTVIISDVAVPHCKHHSVDKSVAAIGISKNGVDWDEVKVKTIFLIVSPVESSGEHLKTLAMISVLCRNKEFVLVAQDKKAIDVRLALSDLWLKTAREL